MGIYKQTISPNCYVFAISLLIITALALIPWKRYVRETRSILNNVYKMQNKKLIFACCSDTHGLHTSAGLDVPVGDVLLFAGDAGLDTKQDIQAFETWLSLLPHAHKVVVMGNMDSAAAVPANAPGPSSKLHTQQKCIPLKHGQSVCDEIVEVAGYRIFGSPWTPAFYGQWQLQSEEAARVHWERLLPPDTQVDIIMTHGPPHGYGDRTKGRHVGDKALLKAVQNLKRPPLLWVCGHIHESVGSYRVPHPAAPGEGILLINAAANNIRLGDSSAAPQAVEITGREKAEVVSKEEWVGVAASESGNSQDTNLHLSSVTKATVWKAEGAFCP